MALQEQRRATILKLIEDRGSVTVVDLAERLAVSMMTIRRDLMDLEKEGSVRRVHGGAVSVRGRSYEPLYTMRAGMMQTEKERIGRAAASMVAEGDSIALDIGTTTLEVARALVGRRNLTVLTPSLHIANLFLNQPEIRVILTGGIMRTVEGSLIGELARHAFRRLHVDRLFLAVACLDASYGLSEYNWDDALIKQAMIESAKEVIVVADSAKFNKVAFAHVADFRQIHKVITDRRPSNEIMEQLNAANVSVILADETNQALWEE